MLSPSNFSSKGFINLCRPLVVSFKWLLFRLYFRMYPMASWKLAKGLLIGINLFIVLLCLLSHFKFDYCITKRVITLEYIIFRILFKCSNIFVNLFVSPLVHVMTCVDMNLLCIDQMKLIMMLSVKGLKVEGSNKSLNKLI